MTFPILSDLGTGMFGQEEYEEIIQAIPHRAPEVILRIKWNCSVDIWNLGVLVSGALSYWCRYSPYTRLLTFRRSGSFSSPSTYSEARTSKTVLQ